MLPILHLGPLAIQTPGLIILIGVWIGMSITERHATRYQVNGGVLSDLIFISLITGVIGARLAYVIHYPSAFTNNPISLISLNLGLFEPTWGLIVGLGVGGFYGWRKRLSYKASLDALTSGLAIFAISYHLSQFASGDGYGSPSNLPWAINLWGLSRHPVQIYAALVDILFLCLVWPRPAWFQAPGQRFVVYIALSAGERLFLEAFRGDSVFWGNFRSAQVIAWLILALCFWIIGKIKVKQDEVPEDKASAETI
jgi:phosphatidylglycerol---prolipoprotein diacylglyceryl transferase